MSNLTINVHIDARAAILAGKTRVGSQGLTLTEEMLSALPEPLRLELAYAYESGETIGVAADEPRLAEATVEALKPILELRAASRARRDEDARVAAAREAEAQAVLSRDKTAKDNARSKALRLWVEKNGDDEQRARMAEGFLPEAEILDMVCEELLEVPGFALYDPLRKGDACECACAGRVNITQGAPRYLDAFLFAKLQSAREDAPEGSTIEVVEHRAACPACACVPIARFELRITMPWHGWQLVRQYALT